MRTEALSGSAAAFPIDSPQIRQETSLKSTKTLVSAPEIIFNNLINLPRLIVDSGGYIMDRLASEAEHRRLSHDAVFRGEEKLTGDGSPAAILPGAATWMWEYDDLLTYLSKSDHPAEAYFPHIVTLGHIDIMYEGAKKFVRKKAREFKGKINLIGHSLGGYFIRKMAYEEPEMLEDCAKRIFIVGAPPGAIVNTAVETFIMAGHLPFSARQIEDFVKSIRTLPEKVDIAGIDAYEIESAHDLIVSRQNRRARGDVATFDSTHRALTRDPDVLRDIVEKLAA